jgi:hypothetical protein
MVIAMAIMWVMQPAVHKVVDVITVRHLFMSAARTMRVRAPGFGRAAQRVGIAHLDNMFVDMISMHVMQMTVVQIIDMVLMVHSRVPTVGTMLMCVIRMMPLGAGGHGFAHLSWVFSGRASQCRLPFEELAFRVISARALLSACLSLPIRPVCSERDIPDVVTRLPMLDAAEIFPRRSRGSGVQRTDGYLRLVFSAHRSMPAFPAPLRRVIGHHWPWHWLARANSFFWRAG